MTKFTTTYNNFSGGKVSEKFKGRFDTDDYRNSLEDMHNMIPDKIGGAFKRPGTKYVQSLDSLLQFNSPISRKDNYHMIPFDSGEDKYIVLVTNRPVSYGTMLDYFHIYQITSSGTTIISSLTFEDVSSRRWSPTTSTFPTDEQNTWQHCQVGDLLFITHSSGFQKPLVLVRTGKTSFELNHVGEVRTEAGGLRISLQQPFENTNISGVTVAKSGTTLTLSSRLWIDPKPFLLKYNTGGQTGCVLVNQELAPGTYDVTNIDGYTGNFTATDDWTKGAWGDRELDYGLETSGNGWPRTVTYHSQRLYWGGNLRHVDTVWGTLVGNLYHLDAKRYLQDSTTDASGRNFFGDISIPSDPLSFPVGSIEANAIKWLNGGRVLNVGTVRGEYIVTGLGTENINVESNSNYGGSSFQSLKSGKDIIFAGASQKNLRTYRYSRENGSWLSDDLTVKIDNFDDKIASNAREKVIREFAWNADNKLLFVTTTEGAYMYGRDPEYGVEGWAEFELGIEADMTVEIISLLSMRSLDGMSEDLWLFTKRTPDGGSATYNLEKLKFDLYDETVNQTTMTTSYVDFHTVTVANGSGSVSGVSSAYNSKEVTAIYSTASDFGFAHNISVSGGVLDYTFPANASVTLGFPYEAHLKTLPPEAGGQFGSSMADIKQIHETYLKLYKTKDFSIGSIDKESGNELNFEDVSFDDLYTGDKSIDTMDNPDTDGQIVIKSTKPTALNILALVSKGQSYD